MIKFVHLIFYGMHLGVSYNIGLSMIILL